MTESTLPREGVWFVYDGDCSVCTYAAEALKIKGVYGSLQTLNAREGKGHPLIDEINRRGLDLDEGMVIYCDGHFYHGEDALRFMAQHGHASGVFNYFNKSLFWSKTLAKLIYPWMRSVRNLLLRFRKVEQIDNLNRKDQPIFQSIFGDAWEDLPPVMRRHYSIRPYSADQVTVEGKLDVTCLHPLKAARPLLLLLGLIPPYTEENVPVTVMFSCAEGTREFCFNRTFYFARRTPYQFRSRMIQIAGNEVVEIMRFGIGWRMKYLWQDGRVILRHKGYVLQWFGCRIPVPLTALFGAGYAEETAVDDNTFDMFVEIRHAWWGKIYGYQGRFKFREEA